MDLSGAVLPHPERALGPGETGVAAAAGGGDGGDHPAGFRVDLLDDRLGDLEQVPAVERRSGMGRHGDGARHRAGFRIEDVQPVAGREPDAAAVEGEAVDGVDAGEGTVFAEDFGRGVFHRSILAARQGPWE